MSQYSARLEISMNSSTSKISFGICACSPFLDCSEFVWFCVFYLLWFLPLLRHFVCEKIDATGTLDVKLFFYDFFHMPWN